MTAIHRNETAAAIHVLQAEIERLLDAAPQTDIGTVEQYERFKTVLGDADDSLQQAYVLANFGDDE